MYVVHVLRHGESTNNIGVDVYDPDLTGRGEEQASKLTGHWDLVVTSNMKRAQRTLDYSQITYDSRLTIDICRERRGMEIWSHLPGEKLMYETHDEILERVELFRDVLRELASKHKSILVVSHCTFLSFLLRTPGVYLHHCSFGSFELDNVKRDVTPIFPQIHQTEKKDTH